MDCKLVSIMAKQNTAMNTPQLMVSWILGESWLMIAGIDGYKLGKLKYCEIYAISMWQQETLIDVALWDGMN